jgi:hypothetical protein
MRFYETAHNLDGRRMLLTRIGSNASCRRHGRTLYEAVGLEVTERYLQERVPTGLNVKISGRSDEEIYVLPGTDTDAFLAVVANTAAR